MTIPRFPGRRRCGKLITLTCVCALLAGWPLHGQMPNEDKSALDDSTKLRVVDSVLSAFETHYVYPDMAAKMSRHVRDRYNNREYDGLTNLEELTLQLTADLMEISRDRHIRVSVMAPDNFSPAIGDTITQDQIAERMLSNCSFRKVEWLSGNIGYLRFDRFEDPSYAGPTAVGAMNFLASCDAVIIDLRYNGGGEEKMVRLISSYFFKKPVQIGSLYFTESDSLEQSWTFSYVPGKKPVDADLYILTSRNTGSGAEAFTYNMKHLKRATVVGEVTRGAAHWVEYYDFPDIQVRAKIPIARPINPVTKTSWERTGVIPHIEIPYDKAFGTAYLLALEKLIEKSSDEHIRRDLEWHVRGLCQGLRTLDAGAGRAGVPHCHARPGLRLAEPQARVGRGRQDNAQGNHPGHRALQPARVRPGHRRLRRHLAADAAERGRSGLRTRRHRLRGGARRSSQAGRDRDGGRKPFAGQSTGERLPLGRPMV